MTAKLMRAVLSGKTITIRADQIPSASSRSDVDTRGAASALPPPVSRQLRPSIRQDTLADLTPCDAVWVGGL